MSTMFPEVCKIEVKVGYHDSVGHLGLSRLFRTQWALTIRGLFTTQWTVSPIQLTLSSCIHDTFVSAMSSLTDVGFSYSLNVDPG